MIVITRSGRYIYIKSAYNWHPDMVIGRGFVSDSLMSLVTFAQDPRSREILRTTLQLGNVRWILTIFRTLMDIKWYKPWFIIELWTGYEPWWSWFIIELWTMMFSVNGLYNCSLFCSGNQTWLAGCIPYLVEWFSQVSMFVFFSQLAELDCRVQRHLMVCWQNLSI